LLLRESASWATAFFLRCAGGAFGSRGFLVRFGFASVVVAELPSAGTFGLRPGFFLAGGAGGIARKELAK